MRDASWCSSLELFDSRLLFRKRRPGGSSDSVWRNDPDRARERIARSFTGRFFLQHEVPFEWIYRDVLSCWPKLPQEWPSIEAPFQEHFGTPRIVAIFGTVLAQCPLIPTLRQYKPWV